ncbi:nitric oxide synthase oxygenase [Chryseomicrobium excrementi]|uniref:Nitric oxide synthase oxygenase n=1 Tax=Chryseomicrobium excrementi TaxID=2041346 RepID=A0A2M9EWW2_9BACL|nr:nitric oxide synthase oxygenase [Chryseomicrobium excrementi]PJK15703.1 nitric oxide synthase oxygenase [Chryseomicrobium excrementi]
MKQKAYDFLTLYCRELNKEPAFFTERWMQIESQIENEGTYTLTDEELDYGSKVAWRNSNKCIGRLFWQTMHVHDYRRLIEPEEIMKALVHHIQYATNGGKIKPTISIFHPSVRIWNHQLLRYAGYERDGTIIGDSDSLAFTKICEELGWKGTGTSFELLPLVVQIGEAPPFWTEIPKDVVLEVPISHPENDQFTELELKWYAVPIISSMKLEVGGIEFPAAPFNGWYMGTEIGARNLADEHRYNQLPKVAELFELNQQSASSLWKDRALVELNLAVLHSFKTAGVSIVDHHTAAVQFRQFEQQEQKQGRDVTGMWSWLIPPLSPAATHVFHKPYNNQTKSPNFFYQKNPY